MDPTVAKQDAKNAVRNPVEKTGKKTDEEIIRGFMEFEGEYLSIDKDRLVLFAISYLERENIEPTLDKITVATFRLFPKNST